MIETAHDTSGTAAKVDLTIPCQAEYIGVARLAILGVAGRMPFTYDEIEDIRLAVGEACTHSVERLAHLWEASKISEEHGYRQIHIECSVSQTSLTIVVRDDVPNPESTPGELPPASDTPDLAEFDPESLGSLLMEILVDESHVECLPQGTSVRLVKVPRTEIGDAD